MKVEIRKIWSEFSNCFFYCVEKNNVEISKYCSEREAQLHADNIIKTHEQRHPLPEIIFSKELPDLPKK